MVTLARCALFVLALLLGACATEVAAPVAAAPSEQEVILRLDQGIVFATGELTEGAAMQASDLVALKNKGDVDLKSGVSPGSTDHLLMKVFHQDNLDIGPNAIFDNLDKVPSTKPDGTVIGEYMRRAVKKNGLVVQNNISPGYTKVWVKLYNAAGGQIVLHYIVIP